MAIYYPDVHFRLLYEENVFKVLFPSDYSADSFVEKDITSLPPKYHLIYTGLSTLLFNQKLSKRLKRNFLSAKEKKKDVVFQSCSNNCKCLYVCEVFFFLLNAVSLAIRPRNQAKYCSLVLIAST